MGITACRRHLGKSRFAPVRNVTRCGSRIAAFLWVGVDYLLLERASREASRSRNATPRVSHLSDLEHVILLATSPRRLGRAGHVELLLLLGDVGQDRAQPLVLDNRCLVDLRPFVEGTALCTTALRRNSLRSAPRRVVARRSHSRA